MSINFIPPDGYPAHWEFLSEEDKSEYIGIRNKFHDEIAKSKRGERIDIFITRLKIIRNFIEREPNDQWKRIIVCGIMFLNDALGINIQQLRVLMGKCKSSINGSLQQLGYIAKPLTHDIDQEITKKVPLLKEDHFQLKKWTIRFGKFPDDKEIRLKPIVKNNQSNFKSPAQNISTIVTSQPSSPITTAQEVMNIVNTHFPCPAKCRHKYYDLIHTSISIQTEA